jgi:uncharacterized protein
MRNILSLDGGGIRGVFLIQILARMEALLREKYQKPDLVLADHFHYIGGTSTGAIAAAILSWGAPVETIERLYLEQSYQVFGRPNWLNRIWAKFEASALDRLLRDFFSVDGEPVLLGTDRLRTQFLCVMRNATTGAPWIITNNPKAKYNDPNIPDNNLLIPLYKLIRASAAAPYFFRPEKILLSGAEWLFIDGAVTPYNNPAFIMYLTATLPCFGNSWEEGEDKIRIISVGTGRVRETFKTKWPFKQPTIYDQINHSLNALVDSNTQHQDLSCRVLGKCLFGESLDSELGSFMPGEINALKLPKRFLYCRYDHNITPEEKIEASHIANFFSLDNLRAIDLLREFGQRFASQSVRIEHLI